ncbi:hypothetical protein [Staphylococcus phage SaGU1]|uniref:Uncharacterized protein n=6 Tax=Kayvirus P108 TaxID=1924731 RepID=A0A3Q9R588_9CAUD|nr:hypothetical protein P108_0223 [Staphylococcus phage P108]AUG85527.1 hypothetical protein HSA30_gp023 [Staphylococcus phage HSA30]AUV57081.1 putative membrane protein [Staphylococcus phage vB_SauM_LM12]AXU40051.1 hypothetical protein VBSavMJYL01_49 [Staphylococcus phage VB_SavM_JYL01]AZU97457.1 hypothetical protein VBSavMJYL02_45 [Staphylococcus phage VB-SavM-JYL02]QEQ93307.1 hypothetical protein [Staphylococcus phage vB_SauH_IME522]QZQ74920.1 hypothetical protein [Staphylococcus phage vB_
MGLIFVNSYFIISNILIIVFSKLNSKKKVTEKTLATSNLLLTISYIQLLAFLIINGIYYSLKYM